MQLNDIIEIVQFDEECREHVRRVRVSECRSVAGYYRIVGVNLHGKNPINYKLPKRAATWPIQPEPETTHWLPAKPALEIDE